MTKTTFFAVMAAGIALAGSSTAQAQTQDSTKGFVDVNVAAQTQSRAIATSTSFPLYGETAAINAAQSVDSGGLFDISGGYKILPAFGVGLGITTFSTSGSGSVIASIPNPNVFNKPVTVTTTVNNLKHSESGTHLLLVYFLPLPRNFEAALSGGPSFFRVSQDVLTATVPAGTQDASVKTEKEKASATGVNAALNLNYLFRPNYGVGVFLRYAGATADLDSAGDVKVGGLQLGGGLRLRF